MKKELSFCVLGSAIFLLLWNACNHKANHEHDHHAHNTNQTATKTTAFQHEGTKKMATLLRTTYDKVDLEQMDFTYCLNKKRAEKYRQIIPQKSGLEAFQVRMAYAEELLKAGATEQAIVELQLLPEFIKSQQLQLDNRQLKAINEWVAIALMRQGEQENCLNNHSVESCILPIQGEGIHQIRTPSQEAIGVYTFLMERAPKDLQNLWLLNLAYMTLGGYPDAVPEQWRIPETAFQSDYILPTFKDVAMGTGVAVTALSGGVNIDDFNKDGLLDIIASSWGFTDPIHFLENQGDGTFKDLTEVAGLTGIMGGLNTIHADYNNDGFVDVFVLRGAWLNAQGRHPNSLLANKGDGTFEDVTEQAGLLSYFPTQTATWADFNADGWLDIFIGNESFSGTAHPSELYINNQDGTFTNMAEQTGLAITGFIKGVISGDYNNDGLPDVYISFYDSPNVLFENEWTGDLANWRFKDVTKAAGVSEPVRSFPAWFWDFDNDGWEDIFVSGYGTGTLPLTHEVAANYLGQEFEKGVPCLYRNNGDGTFTNVAKQQKVNKVLYTMGCNYGDLDNDGFLDFYVGTGDPSFKSIVPNRMFRNNGGKEFQDVTTAGGFGHIQKGHGVGFGDFDNDGDQDIYAVMGGAYEGDVFQNVLFENPVGNKNKWVTLQLEGTKSNKSAIGSRVKITVSNKQGKRRSIYNTVSTGGSFGASSLQQEIGLGDAISIEKVEINWANGANKWVAYQGLSLNAVVKIKEGQTTIETLKTPSFTFKRKAKHEHHHH